MLKSVINYTLSRCTKCLKCIRACPVSALSMHHNRIEINHAKCINCAKCIRTCHSKGLLAHGSTLADIDHYDYTVCMVPPALSCLCQSKEEVEDLFYAIKLLGFDEVIDTSDIYGQVMLEHYHLAEQFEKKAFISSFCPVVNHLLATKYPMLVDDLIPLNYPSEVCATAIRKRLRNHKNLGIFNLCECEAKLALAKYPYDHKDFECDHALAFTSIFPFIKEHLKKGKMPVTFAREGLQSSQPMLMMQRPDVLIADGFEKVSNILEMAEYGMLSDFQLLYLFPCINGCCGGHLLFGNSYLSRNHMDALTCDKHRPVSKLPLDDLYHELLFSQTDTRTFVDKIVFFKQVNEVLDQLPGYDCSACGMQTCRIMAEEIVHGHKSLHDCQILAVEEKD